MSKQQRPSRRLEICMIPTRSRDDRRPFRLKLETERRLDAHEFVGLEASSGSY